MLVHEREVVLRHPDRLFIEPLGVGEFAALVGLDASSPAA
jgi:hypothetical protein